MGRHFTTQMQSKHHTNNHGRNHYKDQKHVTHQRLKNSSFTVQKKLQKKLSHLPQTSSSPTNHTATHESYLNNSWLSSLPKMNLPLLFSLTMSMINTVTTAGGFLTDNLYFSLDNENGTSYTDYNFFAKKGLLNFTAIDAFLTGNNCGGEPYHREWGWMHSFWEIIQDYYDKQGDFVGRFAITSGHTHQPEFENCFNDYLHQTLPWKSKEDSLWPLTLTLVAIGGACMLAPLLCLAITCYHKKKKSHADSLTHDIEKQAQQTKQLQNRFFTAHKQSNIQSGEIADATPAGLVNGT